MDYLIDEFIERYLSRAEIIHRLPVSRPVFVVLAGAARGAAGRGRRSLR